MRVASGGGGTRRTRSSGCTPRSRKSRRRHEGRRVTLSFVSLFAGIGGFDLGFERAGFEPRGMCEIDPHAQGVLRRHWPNVPLHGDTTTLKGRTFGRAEVVVWGSPCQGLSLAGRRAGLEDERSGLFTEGIRFIRE